MNIEYTKGKPFPNNKYYSGVQDYRIIIEHNNIVLGVSKSGYYANWEYSSYDDGVDYGHYFLDDRQAAYEDFCLRSKMVNNNRYFNNDDIIDLACSLDTSGLMKRNHTVEFLSKISQEIGQEIVVPARITIIPGSFSGMDNYLDKLKIIRFESSENPMTIPSSAFTNLPSLESVYISDNITNVYFDAFTECNPNMKIFCGENNTAVQNHCKEYELNCVVFPAKIDTDELDLTENQSYNR